MHKTDVNGCSRTQRDAAGRGQTQSDAAGPGRTQRTQRTQSDAADADHLEHHRAENAGVQLRGCSASCRSLLDHQDRHNRGRLAAEMVHLDVAAARRNLRRRRSLGGTRSPTASPRHACPACEQPSWAKFRKRTDAATSVPKADLGPQRVRLRTVLPRRATEVAGGHPGALTV